VKKRFQKAAAPDARSPASPWIWWGLSACLGYVLLIGPLAKADSNGWLPLPAKQTLNVFYSPIVLLIQKSPAARTFFEWYVSDVWRVRYYLVG